MNNCFFFFFLKIVISHANVAFFFISLLLYYYYTTTITTTTVSSSLLFCFFFFFYWLGRCISHSDLRISTKMSYPGSRQTRKGYTRQRKLAHTMNRDFFSCKKMKISLVKFLYFFLFLLKTWIVQWYTLELPCRDLIPFLKYRTLLLNSPITTHLLDCEIFRKP